MNRVKGVWVVGIILAKLVLSGCTSSTTTVEFWPQDAVRRKPSDFRIDPQKQRVAIENANPENDAVVASARGDFRLIGDRLTFPRYFGVPEEAITQYLRLNLGYKVIGLSESLYGDPDFQRLKLTYEERYNRKLYELVLGDNIKSGRKL